MNKLTVFGQHDDATIAQMERCLEVADGLGVLCADGHKGYSQPVGGVAAYRDHVSISGVGFDIGCGNLCVLTDANPAEVARSIGPIMDRVVSDISFGIGRRNKEWVDHDLFDDEAWRLPAISGLKQMARDQLGTVGSGNHYIDVFVDEQERVWVGVHFGSRGFGHKTATAFLKAAGGKDGMDVPPTLVKDSTALGADYLAAMGLAGRYAYAGREYVARYVAGKILGADVLEEVHNHHNFAWREEHGGESRWVIRKGATPAFPGQKGFVGGSMGDDAVIIEGLASEKSEAALYSTVHGAGRIMSRTEAKGRFVKDSQGKRQRQPGRVRHDEMMEWLRSKGVTLRGDDFDEAPQAYRRLSEVLAAHEGTIKVLHVLRPIGVAMAGSDIVDPYKD